MIRVIAFVLSICCCVGLLSGVHRAVNAQEENLIFTENVIEGDPSVAAGLTVGSVLQMGEHLRWDIRHTLGNPQGDVDFTFFQFDPADNPMDTTIIFESIPPRDSASAPAAAGIFPIR